MITNHQDKKYTTYLRLRLAPDQDKKACRLSDICSTVNSRTVRYHKHCIKRRAPRVVIWRKFHWQGILLWTPRPQDLLAPANILALWRRLRTRVRTLYLAVRRLRTRGFNLHYGIREIGSPRLLHYVGNVGHVSVRYRTLGRSYSTQRCLVCAFRTLGDIFLLLFFIRLSTQLASLRKPDRTTQ